ncbi:MAG: hypothetical protein KUA43_08370 [Hoeflea sp.]|uniref:hypothetical protein n=1 Tax=Hoeflea sp. TaxID=1940281 RepID=UPI001D2F2942|nr:hypothetical protein [Hoeflea sp.]MBU4530851.1 hypothetical protein [Alphaproteobacteria bacterium]MBU4542442.1 hypothetical protein [Alphaproteobacteria bacterium]MBU4552288.1 hypothetical protein [Alphaproteobacteria bacterium]MBV1723443.1 hypothetical protein [Hoeflea sp.]MBV1760213.1 hypothetical protein [Hoeflea sp.]
MYSYRFDAKVLAYDGQALSEPISLGYAPAMLGPAQRMDLLVVPQEHFALEEVSGDDPFVMAEFKVEDVATPAAAAKLKHRLNHLAKRAPSRHYSARN